MLTVSEYAEIYRLDYHENLQFSANSEPQTSTRTSIHLMVQLLIVLKRGSKINTCIIFPMILSMIQSWPLLFFWSNEKCFKSDNWAQQYKSQHWKIIKHWLCTIVTLEMVRILLTQWVALGVKAPIEKSITDKKIKIMLNRLRFT